MFLRGVSVSLLFLCLGESGFAQAYDLTIPQTKKNPFAFGGRAEARYMFHAFDTGSPRFRINGYDQDYGTHGHEGQISLEPSATFQAKVMRANALSHHEFLHTLDGNKWINDLYEGYLSFSLNPQLTIDIGKKTILWGPGYAWNPVGFLNRIKDPDDPSLNLEGRTFLSVNFVKSLTSTWLNNVGLVALLAPVVDDWMNPEWGETGDLNGAAKLYLLFLDTDLEFIYFGGSEQPHSVGFDFARNVKENIEIHGEVAFRKNVPHLEVDRQGLAQTKEENQVSALGGIRYLNAVETTFIGEYYFNGGGYSRDEVEDFFFFLDGALDQWAVSRETSILQSARETSAPFYQQRNLGRHYLYIKVMQKEPFNLLYFNPWITFVMNLQDQSFTLQPGATWAPVTNLELNLRMGIPVGSAHAEFGGKIDDFRTEFWARYYF